MALKRTQRHYDTTIKSFGEVVEDFRTHFEQRGFTTVAEETAAGAFFSITNTNWFKSISGMKTGLNITVQMVEGGVDVSMEVGIFGKKVIPMVIAGLIFWPLLIPQVISLVKQNKLDTEAYNVIEESIRKHEPKDGEQSDEMENAFCPFCGAKLKPGTKFCPECGGTIVHETKCPNCGAVNPKGAKFCAECGTKLEQ